MRSARSSSSWQLLALAVGLGGVIEAAGPGWLKAFFQSLRFGDPGSLSAIALALIASVILHEAGHFLAAMLLDFHLLGISLGPLRLDFWHGRVTVRFMRTLTTGSVSAVPRTCRNWRRRMLIVIASGPIATAALACLAVAGLAHWHSGGWGYTFLAALSQLNFFLFVLGFVPNSAKARVRNDARLFCTVWQDSEAAEEIRIWHELSQLEISGIRPRDYPAATMRRLNPAGRSANLAVLCARTTIDWAIDSGDLASAEMSDRYAFRLLHECDDRIRNTALAISGFFDTLFCNDYDSARSKFAEVRFDAITPVYLARRLRAAAHVAAGDISAALSEIYAARQSLSEKLPRFEFEIELLEKLHRAAIVGTTPRRLRATA